MNNQFDLHDAKSFYDKYAHNYKDLRLHKGLLFNDYIEYPAIVDLLKKLKLKPKKVLDIGCGIGFYSRNFSVIANEVTALDISTEMIAVAKEYCQENLNSYEFEKINFVNSSFENFIYQKEYYDFVLATFMLGYFNNLDVFFNKARKVLSKNGKLVTSTLHPIRMFGEKKGSSYCVDNYFQNGFYESDFLSKDERLVLKRWTEAEISQAAFKNGFLIEQLIVPKPIIHLPDSLIEEAEFYMKNPSILIIVLRRK